MAHALREMRRFIIAPNHLRTGKPIGNFGQMRPREFVANWLICAAMNAEVCNERFWFSTDPDGSDGLIHDSSCDGIYHTEHVIVYSHEKKSGGTCSKILRAVEQKRSRGMDYAAGKILVVFIDEDGSKWHPNRLNLKLPDPLLFSDLWVVSLQKTFLGSYTYAVVRFDSCDGIVPIWKVKIMKGFRKWRVRKAQ